MNRYKVLTATTPASLETQLNHPDNRAYEVVSVTGFFAVSIASGMDPDTSVTVILQLNPADQSIADMRSREAEAASLRPS